MKKISKEQQKRLDELRAEYTAAREQVEQAKSEAEAEIAKIIENINEKIRDVNTVIANANELADQIASEIEDYVDHVPRVRRA